MTAFVLNALSAEFTLLIMILSSVPLVICGSNLGVMMLPAIIVRADLRRHSLKVKWDCQ